MASLSSSSSSSSSICSPFGSSVWLGEDFVRVSDLLSRKLSPNEISHRPGPKGTKVSYLDSSRAIELANHIFHFNGWSSAVVSVQQDYIDEKPERISVGISAVVRVTLRDGTHHEDIGYGTAIANDLASALEKAKKEAVTDARKRALRLFGNGLGNTIYDKEYCAKARSGQLQHDATASRPINFADNEAKLAAHAKLKFHTFNDPNNANTYANGNGNANANAGSVNANASVNVNASLKTVYPGKENELRNGMNGNTTVGDNIVTNKRGRSIKEEEEEQKKRLAVAPTVSNGSSYANDWPQATMSVQMQVPAYSYSSLPQSSSSSSSLSSFGNSPTKLQNSLNAIPLPSNSISAQSNSSSNFNPAASASSSSSFMSPQAAPSFNSLTHSLPQQFFPATHTQSSSNSYNSPAAFIPSFSASNSSFQLSGSATPAISTSPSSAVPLALPLMPNSSSLPQALSLPSAPSALPLTYLPMAATSANTTAASSLTSTSALSSAVQPFSNSSSSFSVGRSKADPPNAPTISNTSPTTTHPMLNSALPLQLANPNPMRPFSAAQAVTPSQLPH